MCPPFPILRVYLLIFISRRDPINYCDQLNALEAFGWIETYVVRLLNIYCLLTRDVTVFSRHLRSSLSCSEEFLQVVAVTVFAASLYLCKQCSHGCFIYPSDKNCISRYCYVHEPFFIPVVVSVHHIVIFTIRNTVVSLIHNPRPRLISPCFFKKNDCNVEYQYVLGSSCMICIVTANNITATMPSS